MRIVELLSLSERQIADLKEVFTELNSDIRVTKDILVGTIENPAAHVFALLGDNERIIGTATLCVMELPTGHTSHIEAVVVKKEYRGQGLGKKLLEHVIDYAYREFPGIAIHLTSNPNRVAANELYKSLGFKKIETNVYRMEV